MGLVLLLFGQYKFSSYNTKISFEVVFLIFLVMKFRSTEGQIMVFLVLPVSMGRLGR